MRVVRVALLALGWTLLQASALVAMEYQGMRSNPSVRDLSRDALWEQYAWAFLALALALNVLIEGTRLGDAWGQRTLAWVLVLVAAAAPMLTRRAKYPTFVPFASACGLAAIVVREAVGRAARGRQRAT